MIFRVPLFHASPGEKEELRFFEFLFPKWLQGKKRNYGFSNSSFPCVSRRKRGTMVFRVPLFHASPGEKEELWFFKFLFSMWLQAKKMNFGFSNSSFPCVSRRKRGTIVFQIPLFHVAPSEKDELRFFEFLFSMRLQAKKRN